MHHRLSLFLILLVGLGLWPQVGSPAAVRLGNVTVRVMNNAFRPEALKTIVPYRSGDTVDRDELDKTLKNLKKIETVQDARYALTPAGKNVFDLDVQILEYRIIRDIRISGNYPFLNKDFQRLLPLQSGNVFTPGYIPRGVENIDNFLKKHGFFDSRITITPIPHKKYNTVDLKVKIRKGKTYRIGEIYITGNKNLRADFLRNKISTFFRYRPSKLKQDLKRMRKAYIRNGFIKARVKLDDVVVRDGERKVDLYITIKENKKLELRFRGQTGFRPQTIRRVLNFTERRSYDSYSIRVSRRRLEEYYRQNGYPDAKITFKTEKSPEKIRVTYMIDAGQRVELAQIRFEGNKSFGGKHLKKQIKSRQSGFLERGQFRIPRLLQDRERLESYYKEQGFIEAEVDAPVATSNDFGDQMRVNFPIHEGERYELGNIVVKCDAACKPGKLRKRLNLKKGDPATQKKLSEAKKQAYEFLYAAGYAYADVEFAGQVDRDRHVIELNINITRGDRVRFRKITVTGNNLTKEKVIRNNLRFKEGEIFSQQKIIDAQLNLRRLGIFSTVKVEPLGVDEKLRDIDVYVFVNELKTYLFKIQAGFDNRNLARGEFSFTKRNLFGLAKQFNLRGIVGKRFNRGEATFFSPRLFGASWNLSNQYFAQFEDAPQFNATSYGAFITTLKNFGPHWTVGFKEQLTRTEVDENNSNITALGNALFDNTFNEFGFFISFDNRDNFSDPSKGFYALVRDELNTDMSNAANQFNTVEVNLSQHQAWGRFSINNIVRYGHNFRIASAPRIPVNKLYFMGGSDTIRGFAEDALNPSGGTVSLMINSELHFRITEGVKLAGFFDTGFLQNNINALSRNDFRESAGYGLRYFTPIGPLRLDHGFILDRRTGEPQSRVHFSFGYFF